MKHLLVILFILLFFFKNSNSQTISSQKGLTTVVFDTKYAIITVYLPDDLQNGDKIFGTYNVYTAGITDEQLAKSLEEVHKYKFNFSNPDNHTNVMQTFINIKPNQLINLLPLKITSSLILSVTESTGKIYKQEIKPVSAPIIPLDGCLTPEHFLLGKPLRITGTFDGNGANTRVNIGNTYFPVLAESPRQCIVDIPVNMPLKDTMEIKVVEDFKPKCNQLIMPVKMTVGYDKIKVKKGETANIYITITGLRWLENTSHLFIENTTPSVINLQDGNIQKLKITSKMLNSENEFKLNLTAQGITAGDFSVDFNLDIPEDFPPEIER